MAVATLAPKNRKVPDKAVNADEATNGVLPDLSDFRAGLAGDNGALGRVLMKYRPGIIRHLERAFSGITDRPIDAEDMVQDAFTNVISKREEIASRGVATCSSYLQRSVINTTRNHLHAIAHHRIRCVNEQVEDDISILKDLVSLRETRSASKQQECCTIVADAFEALKKDYPIGAQALLLTACAGYSLADVAKIFGKSEEAIKFLAFKARYKLREDIANQLEFAPLGSGNKGKS